MHTTLNFVIFYNINRITLLFKGLFNYYKQNQIIKSQPNIKNSIMINHLK